MQWRWQGADVAEADQDGDWVLCAHGPMNALGVIRLVPAAMRNWVLKATNDGIELCRSLIEGGERQFVVDQRHLEQEQSALRITLR